MKLLSFRNCGPAWLALGILASLPTVVCQAAIIWDNGSPNLVAGHQSDFDLQPTIPDDPKQSGDDFTLATAAIASQIQWWGAYVPDNAAPVDNFTIRFFNIVAGTPDSNPFASYVLGNNITRTDSGSDIEGFDVYAYTATIPNTALAAGSYLLSIVNNTTGQTDDWYWAASVTTSPSESWVRKVDNTPWATASDELAFNISSPNGVPESGSSLLFLGLAALAIVAFSRGSLMLGT